jgi:hypothetical protein
MSVRALTDDAQGLLDEIKDQIKQGHIATWAYNGMGDFTQTASGEQWKGKAWFRPKAEKNRLRLRLLKPKDQGLVREVFAVYHGRFIEMLIAHVPGYFTDARATPSPERDESELDDD